jgi:hypothetical protein
LRDILIRVGQANLVQDRWTARNIDEMSRAISRQRSEIPESKLTRLRDLMSASIRDWVVEGYEPPIDGLELPDKDERHVLAAAIACRADAIVTFNLKDSPGDSLALWGVMAWSPDEFLKDLVDLDAKRVWACLQRIADSRRNPPVTIDDVLSELERSGLIEATAALRAR